MRFTCSAWPTSDGGAHLYGGVRDAEAFQRQKSLAEGTRVGGEPRHTKVHLQAPRATQQAGKVVPRILHPEPEIPSWGFTLGHQFFSSISCPR